MFIDKGIGRSRSTAGLSRTVSGSDDGDIHRILQQQQHHHQQPDVDYEPSNSSFTGTCYLRPFFVYFYIDAQSVQIDACIQRDVLERLVSIVMDMQVSTNITQQVFQQVTLCIRDHCPIETLSYIYAYNIYNVLAF